MNTKRNLMIIGAVLMLTGFALTAYSNRVLHLQSGAIFYVGAALGLIGLLIWVVAKNKF